MRPPSKRKNFTMVEIMVVLAIIAILVGMGMAGYKIARKRAAETNTKGAMLKLKVALESFKKKHGYYPQRNTYGTTVNNVPDNSAGNDNFDAFIVPSANDDKLAKFMNLKDFTANNADVYGTNTVAVDHYPCKYSNVNKKGRPLIYICPGTENTDSYDLYSAGPDGIPGNNDDIWSE